MTQQYQYTVPAWSYSTLKQFEKCPHSVYLAKIMKVPQPERAPDHPINRGSRIHALAEDYVTGKLIEQPPELKKFQKEFDDLKEKYTLGEAIVEQEWGFTKNWESTDWRDKNCWLRMKADALLRFPDSPSIKLIDYKTGKKEGNEVSHIQQGQLYAIGAFLKYPDVTFAQVENWYLDKGEKLTKTYPKAKAISIMPKFHARGSAVTQEILFKPKPNIHNCRFCDYGDNGNEACQFKIS